MNKFLKTRRKNAGICLKNDLQISLFFSLEQAILSDPQNLIANWVGSGVCNYTGVYLCSRTGQPFYSNWVGSRVCNYTGVYCAPSTGQPFLFELGRISTMVTLLGIYQKNSANSQIWEFSTSTLTNFSGTVPRKFKNL
ncbi:leucine-rich repeat extensin-like protein 4 [Abeliophyllum distichum]|uniref:Leucine-rich repeat extensin-like protein 4 n=1 Tax=Abeliophyllum distichum TaxID=126358 RepID=A0ABD1SE59_9LAMI